MDPRIADVEREQLRSDLPRFAPGDTVRVLVRVKEGDAKERIQAFEGICIARKGGALRETFTVRKISGGVGVERIFPLHSPSIAGIEIVRRGHVRRAKLYYLRARRGKRARVRERRWWEGPTAVEVAEAAAEIARAEGREQDELVTDLEAAGAEIEEIPTTEDAVEGTASGDTEADGVEEEHETSAGA